MIEQPIAVVADGGEPVGKETDRGALHIAFAAGELPREAQPRRGLAAQARVENARRLEKDVAMQAAEPREFSLLESRYEAEHAGLLAVFQLGLKSDHIEQCAERIVLPQWHHRVELDPGIVRVGQTDRLHHNAVVLDADLTAAGRPRHAHIVRPGAGGTPPSPSRSMDNLMRFACTCGP